LFDWQLRGGPSQFLGLREFPVSGSGFSCDCSLFLGCGLLRIGSDDFFGIVLGSDVLGLHTDALEGGA
jgi:hypothetical protein